VDDFPYFETRGFPKEFVAAENSLCAFDQAGELVRDGTGHPLLDCMCGNVLCGRFDPAKPFFTPHGSFWSSCTTELLASTTEADRQAKTRNRCNGDGYESVTLIPLRVHGETYGLFQFNDKHRDRFTAEKITFLENLVDYVAIALAKLKTDKALRESENRFRLFYETSFDGILIGTPDGTVTAANPAACRMFGRLEEEICRVGRNGLVELNDPRLPVYLEERRRVGKATAELMLRKEDDTRFSAELSSSIFQDGTGHETVGLIIRDITERRQSEDKIRNLHYQHELILNSAGEGIYGVDLDANVTFINVAGAKMLGWDVKEIVGKNSHNTWHHTKADGSSCHEKECSLKELLRRGVGKVGVEDWFWKKDGTGFPVEYTQNPVYEKGSLIGAVVSFNDMTEHKQGMEKLRTALGATVQAISSVVETRDPYTAGHQRRVADLARAIATAMGLTADQIDGLRMAGLIHDIGKISVPAEILVKPTKLSGIEFSLIKTHAQSAYDILKDIDFPWPIARMALEHHERIDGSGYPHGLTGEKVLLESKVLAIADVVEAIASHRPYRPALGIDAALAEITKDKAHLYDSGVVDACLKLFNEQGYRFN